MREYLVSHEESEVSAELKLNGDTTVDALIKLMRHGKVVYYPGSGIDGRGPAIFGSANAAHCFVHIDLSQTPEAVRDVLLGDGSGGFPEYEVAFSEIVEADRLAELLDLPEGLRPRALFTSFKRKLPANAPSQFALVHFQGEGVEICKALWSRAERETFAVIIQDHGFGDTRFGGRNSNLYLTAKKTSLPKYLLVGDGGSEHWPQYEAVSKREQRVPPPHGNGGTNQLYRRRD